MIKEILERKEKVLYQTIKNALENHKVGHSFLLAGDKNPLKLDTAYLIAQSIIEDKAKFADEESIISKRIRNNEVTIQSLRIQKTRSLYHFSKMLNISCWQLIRL